MTPEEKIKDLINGIGAIAETLKLFYDNLVDRGFTPIQALSLTAEFLKGLMAREPSD